MIIPVHADRYQFKSKSIVNQCYNYNGFFIVCQALYEIFAKKIRHYPARSQYASNPFIINQIQNSNQYSPLKIRSIILKYFLKKIFLAIDKYEGNSYNYSIDLPLIYFSGKSTDEI